MAQSLVKTTLQIPDELLREAKARAALRNASLKEFVCSAIRDKLQADKQDSAAECGWRAVFGRIKQAERLKIDRAVEAEFETVDADHWR